MNNKLQNGLTAFLNDRGTSLLINPEIEESFYKTNPDQSNNSIMKISIFTWYNEIQEPSHSSVFRLVEQLILQLDSLKWIQDPVWRIWVLRLFELEIDFLRFFPVYQHAWPQAILTNSYDRFLTKSLMISIIKLRDYSHITTLVIKTKYLAVIKPANALQFSEKCTPSKIIEKIFQLLDILKI
ncbi:hypothetical protein BpHYR1_030844 [Brachionus plicatilis]|uniref:Uncharacterized protein n=1 Tax=Brachionus plicatilis TaxID=10195 RepID=A0A3M7Q3K5_BRAPC|nr:hypothetical protein BpHYR1_030844 [Brachionus plicatilis]